MLRAVFDLPTGWSPTGDVVEAAMDLPEPLSRAPLDAVRRFVEGLPGERDSWVLLREDRVAAVLTLRGRPVAPTGLSQLVELLYKPLPGNTNVDVINRTFRETVLPAGKAVETHDFSVAHGLKSGTRPASERATVTIFPEPGEWAVEFMLVTQDLLLFDDATDYLHTIAESVAPFTLTSA